MRKLAALIAAAAALGFAPHHANAQQLVTCESVNNHRAICGVNTSGGVAIRQQLSSTPCVQGRDWGYTRNAIWVSNGCRAQFVTNASAYRSGRYGNANNRYNNGAYDNRYNNGANDPVSLCRRAVRSQQGRVEVSTWNQNNSRNNARIGFRASNGSAGECRIDRNGNVSLRYTRR